MKTIISALLSIAIASVLYAESGTIKIVSSLPLTGSGNAVAMSMSNGIRMALEDAGHKSGDFEIAYESLDDASPERGSWDPNVEAGNADRAIQDPDVMVYIGTYNSGAAKISMPKLNDAGLAMVSPGNTWPGLTKPGIGEPNEPSVYRPSGAVTFFRVVPADDIQGNVGAKWALAMGLKRVFIVHDRELYGKGLAGIFEKTAKQLGMTILGVEGIDTRAPNFRSLATKIRQLNPDLVFVGGVTQSDVGQVVKDLRNSGSKVKLMVPDGCFDSAFIQSAGAQNVNGSTYATFGGVPPEQLTGRGQDFYVKYKAKFGMEPESYGAYGYEAAAVSLEAIRRAGKKDRKAIVDALRGIRDFEGVLGTWSFDENGDTTLTVMSGNIVEDGKFKFLKLLQ